MLPANDKYMHNIADNLNRLHRQIQQIADRAGRDADKIQLLAVSKGQTEAAYALGMRPNRTLQLIIIPQALRVIVPPLASQYLNLTKNSSLAIAIGYMDITATIGGITLMQTGKEMETMLIVMCCYLVFSLTISALMNWFNRSIELKER